MSGLSLNWVNEIRYLGIFIVKSRYFKCSLDYAKRSFYRAANSIFGLIGRIASKEVTVQLTLHDRFFMKLFKTNNINTVKFCQIQLGYQLPSIIIQSRTDSFLNKI